MHGVLKSFGYLLLIHPAGHLKPDQVKELNEIMSSYENFPSHDNIGWKWRVKENLKPSSEYGQGQRMCLFLNIESNLSMENSYHPWQEDV